MAENLELHGYTVRFRIREQRKRKKKIEGKRTRFYEGEYVYLRVKGPDGRERDLYLGTKTKSATPAKARGEKGSASSPARAARGAPAEEGRKQGGNASSTDEMNPRQRALYEQGSLDALVESGKRYRESEAARVEYWSKKGR